MFWSHSFCGSAVQTWARLVSLLQGHSGGFSQGVSLGYRHHLTVQLGPDVLPSFLSGCWQDLAPDRLLGRGSHLHYNLLDRDHPHLPATWVFPTWWLASSKAAVEKAREGASKRVWLLARWRPVFVKFTMDVPSHHSCCLFFIRIGVLGPAHMQRRGWQKGMNARRWAWLRLRLEAPSHRGF